MVDTGSQTAETPVEEPVYVSYSRDTAETEPEPAAVEAVEETVEETAEQVQEDSERKPRRRGWWQIG